MAPALFFSKGVRLALICHLEWFGEVIKVPMKRYSVLGLNAFACWESCLLILLLALMDILLVTKVAKAVAMQP